MLFTKQLLYQLSYASENQKLTQYFEPAENIQHGRKVMLARKPSKGAVFYRKGN